MLQHFDERNREILVHVGGELHSRNDAKVSVFDSVVQGGDAVWEGLRLYDGGILNLHEHLDRMHYSAHALAFQSIPSKEEIIHAIEDTLRANQMRDGVHIRLTLTRGEKYTSGMDPRINDKGCTLIVLAEWKAPVYDRSGLKLISSSIRRNSPQFLDSKIHHNNLLNNILAKIEANVAGVDDALMLDDRGFVAETNACNIFFFSGEVLHTPFADACLPGITRNSVIALAQENGIVVKEGKYSQSQFYAADVVFVSGTMGELARVSEIDGRAISNSEHEQYSRLLDIFRQHTLDHRTLLEI